MGVTKPEQWTTRTLLKWMAEHFAERGIDSPRVVAEMLLGHVLGCERMRLYMEADRPATDDERQRLRTLVQRASAHEPVQYLVGEAWFFTRPFEVNRSVLIPRPSTETLVERVLGWCRKEEEGSREPGAGNREQEDGHRELGAGNREDEEKNRSAVLPTADMGSGAAAVSDASLRIADVGTGTGCIAVSLAAQLPNARVLATDVSDEALAVARRNAQRHDVDEQIEFAQGDLLEPVRAWLGDATLDVLCSNPPYISDAQWADVAANVKEHEPASALRAGADGLDFIHPLIEGAGDVLRPGGLLAIETANIHGDDVRQLLQSTGVFERMEIARDAEGHDRVVLATRT